MSFLVLKPGFYTTVQDAGRFGYAGFGLSKCGALDEHAFRWANYLLDNAQTDAVLEITFGDCYLEAQSSTVIAITGAEIQFEINDQPKANWSTHIIQAGDRLRWRSASEGVRGYLAVKGGLQTEQWYGSRSVNLREQLGRLLVKQDKIHFEPYEAIMPVRHVPMTYRPDYSEPLKLHMLPCYQFNQFTTEQVKMFFKNRYRISQQTDRTGCRLEGEALTNVPVSMTSEGMVVGSVEITSKGLPIILLNDAPTIGGYPKIGTVISADLAKLAQRPANTEVQFTLIDIDEAQALKRHWLNFFSTSIAPINK